MHLELRRKYEEDYKEVGESMVGIGLQDINKLCILLMVVMPWRGIASGISKVC